MIVGAQQNEILVSIEVDGRHLITPWTRPMTCDDMALIPNDRAS